ncbi:MAG: D-2-hydroxyacid dehydrogenase [Eubacteriales bacterium]|nr:D-2-hydroxyacid dehydrogenase [Eubacteriales bacterium]
MERCKVAVLWPCDGAQRAELERSGGERCEFLYAEGLTREERLPLLQQAEVIFGEPGIREIVQCPKLRWIQLSWAGTDAYTMREGFPQRVALTNASGCFRTVIPEYVLAVLLEMCRNLKDYAAFQQQGIYRRLREQVVLSGKRALIMGAGDIGTGTARRLKAFDVHVTGMRRTERNYPDCYDAMITRDGLSEALGEADIVVGCLPFTKDTVRMLDAEMLGRMKDDALLVNVGRGNLIDTDALVRELQAGRFRGVALDVTDPEPLPPGHPLWSMDRVVLTPHVAGQSFGFCRDTEDKVVRLACRNLERYLEGKEPENLVNFETGYAS